MDSLSSTFQQSSDSPAGICNLCFENSKNLQSHIARHLQRIALFALPRVNSGSDIDSVDAYGEKETRFRRASAAADGTEAQSDVVSEEREKLEEKSGEPDVTQGQEALQSGSSLVPDMLAVADAIPKESDYSAQTHRRPAQNESVCRTRYEVGIKLIMTRTP